MVMHTLKEVISRIPLNRILFILLLFGMFQQAASAANITVKASRNPVALDDSFHIIYEADSSVDDPDFTPVYQYFDVLSSSQSTNMRSINGDWSLKKSWDLTVIARDVGNFTLPPIQFGRDISPSIKIKVTNSTSPNSTAPNGQASVPAQIFLESTLDKKQGRVEEQFIYTTRLLRTVTIAGASLSDPQVSDQDAIVQLIGEDNYQTTRSGIRYEVFERRYAVYPQNSGKLKISPMRFEGRINATQPRTIFDQFRMSGQLKRLYSNAVEAEVKPAPSNIPLQDWLPAKKVQLIEEWSGDIQNLTTDEPVTRTITLSAEGLTGVQLGELDFPDVDGLKLYPDKAVYEDNVTGSGITGTKTFKVAIIPTRAGHYTLPGITVNWWNTDTDKAEQVSIPASQLNVFAGAGSPQTAAPAIPAQPGQTMGSIDRADEPGSPAKEDGTKTTAAHSLIDSLTDSDRVDNSWRFAAIAFAAAWLITLLLLIREKLGRTDAHGQVSPSPGKLAEAVRRAAKSNDAEATRTALIAWAKNFYGDTKILNLSHINTRCSAELADHIRLLSQALYADDGAGRHDDWQGPSLLQAFEAENRSRPSKHDGRASVLKPLYTHQV